MALLTFVVSISAYSARNSFRQESLHRIDEVARAPRTFYNLNRWISIRTDAVTTTFSTVLAIYLVHATGAIQKPGSAVNVGFSLNMAVGFGTMILWWVRCLKEFEVGGNRYDLLALCRKVNLILEICDVAWNEFRSTQTLSRSPSRHPMASPPPIGPLAENWLSRTCPPSIALTVPRFSIASTSTSSPVKASALSVAQEAERVR